MFGRKFCMVDFWGLASPFCTDRSLAACNEAVLELFLLLGFCEVVMDAGVGFDALWGDFKVSMIVTLE